MTTRPAPTKASHYVAGILSGLRSFLDGDAAGRLSPDARTEIAQVISWICRDRNNPIQPVLGFVELPRDSYASIKELQKEGGSAAPLL